MKKRLPEEKHSLEMRAEYDFSHGVRGKYSAMLRSGTYLVALDADVAKAFPDTKSANAALRELLAVARRAEGRKRAS